MATVIDEYIHSYTITKRINDIGEKATVVIGDLSTVFQEDQDVTLDGRSFFVSKSTRRLANNDTWQQQLELTSPIVKLAEKSPKKKQVFMTMTREDYNKFLADAQKRGGIGYLDYTPHIQFGDEYGDNGWTAHEVIKKLAEMGGMTIHLALPDYPVKQHTIIPGQTFFDSVLFLVTELDPFYYSVGGQIFIVESGIMERDFGSANAYTLQTPRFINEEIIRKDKPSQIRVVGELGSFRVERYKGSTSQNLQEVMSRIGNYTIRNMVYGTETDYSWSQIGPSVIFLGPSTRVDPNTGIVEGWAREKLTTRYGKDIYGNRGSVVDTTRLTYKRRYFEGVNYGTFLFAITRAATYWENTHYNFTNPRPYGNIVGQDYIDRPGKYESIDQAVWYPTGSSVVFQLYNNLEERYTYFWYDENGTLVKQSTITWGMVYTDDDVTFTRLQDIFNKDEISPTGTVKRLITRTEKITYEQVSRDTYAEQISWADLTSDGSYSQTISEARHVQAGAVQGSRPERRKMQVYAESGTAETGNAADMIAVMDTPGKEVNIKTPNWAALETIEPLVRNKLTRDEVVRRYVVSGVLDVHLGLQVEMPTETHHQGQQIQAPVLASGYRPIIVGYQIQKDGINDRATTEVTLRGRLA